MHHILFINPNSSASLTQELERNLKSPKLGLTATTRAEDVEIDFYTAPAPSPSSIDGPEQAEKSSDVVLAAFGFATSASDGEDGTMTVIDGVRIAQAQLPRPLREYEAIIVACYSPHPLVPSLRSRLSSPSAAPPVRVPHVLGIFESSIGAALRSGGTFGIVTTGKQWEPVLLDGARKVMTDMGATASDGSKAGCVGVRGSGVGVLDLVSDEAEPADSDSQTEQGRNPSLPGSTDVRPPTSMLTASLDLVLHAHAEVIVVGCAGMSPVAEPLEKAIQSSLQDASQDNARDERGGGEPRRVPVVDGVKAAIEWAVELVKGEESK